MQFMVVETFLLQLMVMVLLKIMTLLTEEEEEVEGNALMLVTNLQASISLTALKLFMIE